MKQQLAIYASGTGSNAGKIMEYFAANEQAEVALVVYNRKAAKVRLLAEQHGVKALYVPKTVFETPGAIVAIMQEHHIDFIALAGFLLKLPDDLIAAYPDKIVNIHPSLLPKFGGAGMYGMHVHHAVVEAGETVSGITIHRVNEVYDDGEILFQAQVALLPEDTPEMVQQKVLKLEHQHYPEVIARTMATSK